MKGGLIQYEKVYLYPVPSDISKRISPDKHHRTLCVSLGSAAENAVFTEHIKNLQTEMLHLQGNDCLLILRAPSKASEVSAYLGNQGIHCCWFSDSFYWVTSPLEVWFPVTTLPQNATHDGLIKALREFYRLECGFVPPITYKEGLCSKLTPGELEQFLHLFGGSVEVEEKRYVARVDLSQYYVAPVVMNKGLRAHMIESPQNVIDVDDEIEEISPPQGNRLEYQKKKGMEYYPVGHKFSLSDFDAPYTLILHCYLPWGMLQTATVEVYMDTLKKALGDDKIEVTKMIPLLKCNAILIQLLDFNQFIECCEKLHMRDFDGRVLKVTMGCPDLVEDLVDIYRL